MADRGSPKLSLGLNSRGELHQKLIMTPRVRNNISDEEDEKRLFAPPKKEKLKK